MLCFNVVAFDIAAPPSSIVTLRSGAIITRLGIGYTMRGGGTVLEVFTLVKISILEMVIKTLAIELRLFNVVQANNKYMVMVNSTIFKSVKDGEMGVYMPISVGIIRRCPPFGVFVDLINLLFQI